MKGKGKDRRLRTGCLICKLRHIKCGEERPSCTNCVDANRKCMGYPVLASESSSSSASSSALISPNQVLQQRSGHPLSKALTSRPQWTQKEVRSFSFGIHKTVPNITTYFNSEFWGIQIPRLAHQIPAIRHALSALATFHEKSKFQDIPALGQAITTKTTLVPASVDKFFLQQYNKAIVQLNNQITGDGLVAALCTLICCVIFVCIEGLHGRQQAMVNHIQAGLKVYHEWLGQINPDQAYGATSIEAIVSQMFRRIDYHAATFIDGHVPQSQTLNVIQPNPPIDDFKPVFHSMEDARGHVDSLLGRLFWFLRVYEGVKFQGMGFEKIPQEIRDKHRIVGIWLHLCGAALDRYVRLSDAESTSKGLRSATLLKLRVKVLTVFHRRWPDELAISEDCESDFQAIIELSRILVLEHVRGLPTPEDSDQSISSSEESSNRPYQKSSSASSSSSSHFQGPPVFTLETGVIPPLYYVAVSASTALIRQEAISLLRTANLREGLWSSGRTAEMAEARLAENSGIQSPVTGAEMSELTKKLWSELKLEENDELSN